MISWAKDLRNDPHILRTRYARAAIAQGVRRGIEDHGDDFVFGADQVAAPDGAGAWLDTDDPALTEWYVEATSGSDGTPGAPTHKDASRPAATPTPAAPA